MKLYTPDAEATKAFCAATVGWAFEGMPMGGGPPAP
jgi:hypothetical protein